MKKDVFSEIWKRKEIVRSRVRMMTRESITPLTLFINLCCKSADTTAAGSINGSPSQGPPDIRPFHDTHREEEGAIFGCLPRCQTGDERDHACLRETATVGKTATDSSGRRQNGPCHPISMIPKSPPAEAVSQCQKNRFLERGERRSGRKGLER